MWCVPGESSELQWVCFPSLGWRARMGVGRLTLRYWGVWLEREDDGSQGISLDLEANGGHDLEAGWVNL